jgi:hypothetical protein
VTAVALPLIELHHPTTFKGRGVAAPFTTPLLAGTRVRESSRTGVELLVPNLSGGRSFYVLNWPGVRALCNPTLHDAELFRRFRGLALPSPALVREAALEVALEGHAGREAAAAAAVATAQDGAQRLLARSLLMTGLVKQMAGLVEQLDPNGAKSVPRAERTAEVDRRASAILHRIAPSFGQSAAQLAAGLTAIGDVFAPVGIAAADRGARIPRLLTRLRNTHADLSLWLDADPSNDIGGLGPAVAAAMQRASASGEAVLARTRSTLMDPQALLRRWMADASGLSALVSRCDWLLDGWERVSLLWLSASSGASRRAALLEMASLVPVLPREVTEWTETPIHPDMMKETCRVTSHQDAWRTGGSAFALIERNEKLLAMST